jgi:hypothetical protein
MVNFGSEFVNIFPIRCMHPPTSVCMLEQARLYIKDKSNFEHKQTHNNTSIVSSTENYMFY